MGVMSVLVQQVTLEREDSRLDKRFWSTAHSRKEWGMTIGNQNFDQAPVNTYMWTLIYIPGVHMHTFDREYGEIST